MATPVLVRAYNSTREPSVNTPSSTKAEARALPPVSAYAFADIFKTADCPDLQSAITGIAEICAKNRMSLADEYASHMPPLGEITASSTTPVKPSANRPIMRRPLTSVPEASSSSSEGSVKSKKRRRIFSFGRQSQPQSIVVRQIRIGSTGRTVSVSGLTALTASEDSSLSPGTAHSTAGHEMSLESCQPSSSKAVTSLRRLLSNSHATEPS